jgi:hypothetical protein
MKRFKLIISGVMLAGMLFALSTPSQSSGCTEYKADWQLFDCARPGTGCIECIIVAN